MNFPDFVLIDPPLDSNSSPVILYTNPPFYIGKVVKIEREQDYYDFKSNLSYPVGDVSGYRILILPAGTLNEYEKVEFTPEQVLSDMAAFYLQSRVIIRPYGFKKVKKP